MNLSPTNQIVHKLFELQAARTPDAVAVMSGSEKLTYSQLDSRGNQVAHALIKSGVNPDQRVCLFAARGIEMVSGLIGIWKAGAASVPVDPAYPANRIEFMIKDSAPVAILAQSQFAHRLIAFGVPVIELSECFSKGATGSVADELNPRNLAYVIYTSGTTGLPKGVMIEHGSVCNLLRGQRRYIEILPGSRVLQFASTSFDASIWEILTALCNGASLYIPEVASALAGNALADMLHRLQITHALLPPIVVRSLPGSMDFEHLNTLVVGGEPCPERLVDRWASGRCLINAYGPTEATICATMQRCVAGAGRPPSIGRPLPGVEAYILDDKRQPVPIGDVGEIYIGGLGVARGYLNQPTLTAAKFLPNPFCLNPEARLYQTGDLARWQPDGTIEYCGRGDHQVKIRGCRVELGEVENQLLRNGGVRSAVVVPRESGGETQLAAYVVPEFSCLDSPVEGGANDINGEMVGNWKSFYESTYAVADFAPSFVGWNSSYTGQPIPQEEMQEWLQNTVATIGPIRSLRVLEIGCGVGLLLMHLAPSTSVYCGTDISAEALLRVQTLQLTRADLQHVELIECSALQLDRHATQWDLVILNSVVQYFPNHHYLLEVLKRVSTRVSPGGRIFVGDVRHLGLLPVLHASAQFQRAAMDVTLAQLRSRIAQALTLEAELALDPCFFEELPERLPKISRVGVSLKRGRGKNELTRYRYDVILQVGNANSTEATKERIEWQTSRDSPAGVTADVQKRGLRSVEICGIPNRRLSRELAITRFIDSLPGSTRVEKLHELLTDPLLEVGEDPEDLREIGEANKYDVCLRWSSDGGLGYFDVEWRAGPSSPLYVPDGIASNKLCAAHKRRSAEACANDPRMGHLIRQLLPELRDHLRNNVPDYMIPTDIIALKELPMTANGKVDRKALPEPAFAQEIQRHFSAPVTSLEEVVAGVWADVLELPRVSANDRFFDIGGDSLKLARVLDRLTALIYPELTIVDLFKYPTIRDLCTYCAQKLEAH